MAFDYVIVNKEIDSIPVKPTQMNKMFDIRTIVHRPVVLNLFKAATHKPK